MLQKTLLETLSVIACLTTRGTSWETQVHNQIGFMADVLINEATRAMVKTILEPQYNGSLGKAAAWADDVRRTTHPYSYTWHFISAKDNPPNDCGLFYHRDCQVGGCNVQQISNQTKILEDCIEKARDGKDLPGIQCSESLKFVTHFVGDIAQPLHTSERSLGGNSVKVKFDGRDTNLHQVWDKEILYTLTSNPDGFGSSVIHPYFVDLVARIHADSFRAPRSTWAMCDLDARRGTYCPELWAKDSNAIVCDYAYGKYVEGTDLLTGEGKYAHGALPIIEQQVAKAAWRLSGWLDALTESVMKAKDMPLNFQEENSQHVDMADAVLMGTFDQDL